MYGKTEEKTHKPFRSGTGKTEFRLKLMVFEEYILFYSFGMSVSLVSLKWTSFTLFFIETTCNNTSSIIP